MCYHLGHIEHLPTEDWTKSVLKSLARLYPGLLQFPVETKVLTDCITWWRWGSSAVTFQHHPWSMNLPWSWSCCVWWTFSSQRSWGWCSAPLCSWQPFPWQLQHEAAFSITSPSTVTICTFIFHFFLNCGLSSFFVRLENDFPYALLYLGLWGRKWQPFPCSDFHSHLLLAEACLPPHCTFQYGRAWWGRINHQHEFSLFQDDSNAVRRTLPDLWQLQVSCSAPHPWLWTSVERQVSPVKWNWGLNLFNRIHPAQPDVSGEGLVASQEVDFTPEN